MVNKVNNYLNLLSSSAANNRHDRGFKDYLSLLLVLGFSFVTTDSPASANSLFNRESVLTLNSQSKVVVARSEVASGNQIILNGKKFTGAWVRRQQSEKSPLIYLSDGALKQIFGVDLLNSRQPARQGIQWFSSFRQPLILSSWLTTGYRYLDITNLAASRRWQIQVNGKTLAISTQPAKIKNISQQTQGTIKRVVVDLDRPTPWQIRQEAPRKRKPRPQAPGVKTPGVKTPGVKTPVGVQKKQPAAPKPPPLNRDWTILVW